MSGRKETLIRALEALAEICGPIAVNARLAKTEVMRDDERVKHDPSFWNEDFFRWALDRCVYRDRCFCGVGALCADFGSWAVFHNTVPCTRRIFQELLENAGLFIADGLVYGLILREDLESLTSLQDAPEGCETRARPMNGDQREQELRSRPIRRTCEIRD